MRHVILLSGHKNVTGVGENRLAVVQRDATLLVRLHHADIDMRGRWSTRSIVMCGCAGGAAATPAWDNYVVYFGLMDLLQSTRLHLKQIKKEKI